MAMPSPICTSRGASSTRCNPGFRQLGSVWLPLPHLLLIPFVQRMTWWQSGLAGAIPSIGCYILGCVGIYRLARLWLDARVASVAAAFYGLNPGLLYMQTTAMTEPLFLAEMIWAALLIAEFCRAVQAGLASRDEEVRASRLLLGAGLVLVAAVFTRYDGWIFASFAWLVAAIAMFRSRGWQSQAGGAFRAVYRDAGCIAAAWMAYNAQQFGDPLDFLRGPYSAKAIEERTTPPGAWHHPGWHSMPVSALYFLKAAELGAAPLAIREHAAVAVDCGHNCRYSRGGGAQLGGAAAVGAAAVLCILGGLRFGADLSFRCGGRIPGTTHAMAWKCCPPLRSLSPLVGWLLDWKGPGKRRWAGVDSCCGLLLIVINSVPWRGRRRWCCRRRSPIRGRAFPSSRPGADAEAALNAHPGADSDVHIGAYRERCSGREFR
jgi:hypothetical protein